MVTVRPEFLFRSWVLENLTNSYARGVFHRAILISPVDPTG